MSQTKTAVATATPVEGFKPRPLQRVDRALIALRKTGLPIPQSDVADKPLVGLIKDLLPFGETEVVAITRTLGHAEVFNQVVREQLDATHAGTEYTKISQAFTSIREDAKTMLGQIEDGQLNWRERLQSSWMNMTRGSIPSRFNKISAIAKDVFRTTEDRLAKMTMILEGYGEFRMAIKESTMLAQTLRERTQANYEKRDAELKAAQEAVEASEAGSQAMNEAELNRDLALRAFRDADRVMQISRDLYDNLSISYNTGDVIMARLSQTATAQERVWSQSVTFFNTNESVLTALSASFTMLKGLHESTQTHEEMKKGINNALSDLGNMGTKVQEDALRAGYGPTISHEAVKTLVDSIVDYQARSRTIIEEMRAQAIENERTIARDTEDGRRRLVALLTEPNRDTTAETEVAIAAITQEK